MKKLIYIILIIISLILFSSLIYIAINAKDLGGFITTIGFFIISYLSVILFAVSWLKLKK